MDNFGEPTGEYNAFNANEEQYDSKVTDLYGAARVAFIRKVYTILSSKIYLHIKSNS